MDKESGRATSFDVVKREVVEVIDAIKEKLMISPRLSRKSQQILERIRRQQGIGPDGRILSGRDDEEPLWVGDEKHKPPPHDWTF